MPPSPEHLIEITIGKTLELRSQHDLPIGAAIFRESGELLLAKVNSVIESRDPSAHAEILVLRELASLHFELNYDRLSLAVILEPCPMCAWAIRSLGIGTVVFGAYNPNYGAAGSAYDLLRDNSHGPAVQVFGGVLASECKLILGEAFREMRNNSRR